MNKAAATQTLIDFSERDAHLESLRDTETTRKVIATPLPARLGAWQQQYLDRIRETSNEALLAEMRTLAMFQKNVEPMRWEVVQFKKGVVFGVLEERLLKSGFVRFGTEDYRRLFER